MREFDENVFLSAWENGNLKVKWKNYGGEHRHIKQNLWDKLNRVEFAEMHSLSPD